MTALFKIIKEQFQSFYMIQRLAIFQMKIDNQNNYLGYAWEVLNPAIQMAMYWFVFGLGVRANRNVDHIPYVLWMLAGICMWFFINKAILDGTKSIYKKYSMVSKMNFPLSTLPSYIITSRFYSHLVLVGILIVVFWFSGYPPTIYYLQLIYFLAMSYIYAFAITLLTSTIAVVIRDVQMVIQSILRIMFFVSPILWLPNRLPEWIQEFLKYNPFHYLANGYRASLLYGNWYAITNWKLTLYNWAIIFVLLLIGSIAHFKFRNRFSDFI